MFIAATIILLMVIIAAGITQFGYLQITRMKVKNDPSLFSILENLGLYSRERYEALVKKEVVISSIDGLKLSGAAIESFPDSKRWMIIVHGYTGSRAFSTQFIDLFTDEGFNVLLIDQRRHGQSEGRYTTYGFYEKFDIQTWVDWLVQQHGEDVEIGLHGQSLGGGTVLEYLSISAPQVKFVIADCPYSDLTELMKHQLTTLNKVPSVPFFRWVNNRIRKKAGFSFEQVSPIRAVRESRLPVMFIHGTHDTYVPTRMSLQMYEEKPEPKKLVLIEGATHANAYHVGMDQYRREVRSFLHDYMGKSASQAESEPARRPLFQDKSSVETV